MSALATLQLVKRARCENWIMLQLLEQRAQLQLNIALNSS
jgi:hypothetical protein